MPKDLGTPVVDGIESRSWEALAQVIVSGDVHMAHIPKVKVNIMPDIFRNFMEENNKSWIHNLRYVLFYLLYYSIQHITALALQELPVRTILHKKAIDKPFLH